jgi:uncharacterized coiled-coil protein SlyX
MSDLTNMSALIASAVSAVAFIVTSWIITRRNERDIKELTVRITKMDESVSARMSTMEERLNNRMSNLETRFYEQFASLEERFTIRLGAVESDVAVIKALCQERSQSR